MAQINIDKVTLEVPEEKDRDEMIKLFNVVLKDNWEKNDLMDFQEGLLHEMETKREYLDAFLNGEDGSRFFLTAKLDGRIIGTIEHGEANETIRSVGDPELNKLQEVGTLFVLPEYQGCGVGNKLIHGISQRLVKLGKSKFCIDSGYITAQKIWTKKYGAPTYFMKDYWGPGGDHMVWVIGLEDK